MLDGFSLPIHPFDDDFSPCNQLVFSLLMVLRENESVYSDLNNRRRAGIFPDDDGPARGLASYCHPDQRVMTITLRRKGITPDRLLLQPPSHFNDYSRATLPRFESKTTTTSAANGDPISVAVRRYFIPARRAGSSASAATYSDSSASADTYFEFSATAALNFLAPRVLRDGHLTAAPLRTFR